MSAPVEVDPVLEEEDSVVPSSVLEDDSVDVDSVASSVVVDSVELSVAVEELVVVSSLAVLGPPLEPDAVELDSLELEPVVVSSSVAVPSSVVDGSLVLEASDAFTPPVGTPSSGS